MPERAPQIQIPRWIQLVGLPLVLLFLWTVAGDVRRVIFLFLVASLIALVLGPVVGLVTRLHVPRGLAVAIVYAGFVFVVLAIFFALGTLLVDKTQHASDRFTTYVSDINGPRGQTDADRDVDRLQKWLDGHGLSGIAVQERGHNLVRQLREKDVGRYTARVVDFVKGAAVSVGRFLFEAVLILVVSIYMLLDTPRLARVLDRRFPPRPGSRPLLRRMEWAVLSYVKGQFLVSLIIGTSAGVGMWLLGVVGGLPGVEPYALVFGLWAGVTELIPYIGPWLGAIPAGLYALVTHPVALIWVTLLYLFIHQIEGHVVIPNVMGSALRLHPLLVIFGLLAGGEIYGFPGVLVALPFLAACRAGWEFFSERVAMEPWPPGATVPVFVEAERPVPGNGAGVHADPPPAPSGPPPDEPVTPPAEPGEPTEQAAPAQAPPAAP